MLTVTFEAERRCFEMKDFSCHQSVSGIVLYSMDILDIFEMLEIRFKSNLFAARTVQRETIFP